MNTFSGTIYYLFIFSSIVYTTFTAASTYNIGRQPIDFFIFPLQALLEMRNHTTAAEYKATPTPRKKVIVTTTNTNNNNSGLTTPHRSLITKTRESRRSGENQQVTTMRAMKCRRKTGMTRAWTAPARGGVTWSARRGSVDIRITKASAVRLARNITYNLSSFAVDERVWRIICQSHQ